MKNVVVAVVALDEAKGVVLGLSEALDSVTACTILKDGVSFSGLCVGEEDAVCEVAEGIEEDAERAGLDLLEHDADEEVSELDEPAEKARLLKTVRRAWCCQC